MNLGISDDAASHVPGDAGSSTIARRFRAKSAAMVPNVLRPTSAASVPPRALPPKQRDKRASRLHSRIVAVALGVNMNRRGRALVHLREEHHESNRRVRGNVPRVVVVRRDSDECGDGGLDLDVVRVHGVAERRRRRICAGYEPSREHARGTLLRHRAQTP